MYVKNVKYSYTAAYEGGAEEVPEELLFNNEAFIIGGAEIEDIGIIEKGEVVIDLNSYSGSAESARTLNGIHIMRVMRGAHDEDEDNDIEEELEKETITNTAIETAEEVIDAAILGAAEYDKSEDSTAKDLFSDPIIISSDDSDKEDDYIIGSFDFVRESGDSDDSEEEYIIGSFDFVRESGDSDDNDEEGNDALSFDFIIESDGKK